MWFSDMVASAVMRTRYSSNGPDRSIVGGLEKVCPMGSALVLVGAIGCTLVAAYQWAARVGAFGAATTVLAAVPDALA